MNANTKLKGIMPVIGLGTWKISGKSCVESVNNALDMGYSHIDTAQIYDNEKEVGKGIHYSGVPRKEIFLTTKIATHNLKPKMIRESFEKSLQNLGTSYVDLLLIHWPTPEMDLKACLDTFFELREQGNIKEAGVSNFSPSLFEKALEIGPVFCNQVKLTPYHEQFQNIEVAKAHGKVVTAYSPFEQGEIIDDETLTKIGEKYGKTASQIILKWLIDFGNVAVIPKSESAKHQKENLEIFDIQLSEEDRETIKGLHKHHYQH
jgi:2,5-diketo-D-gluconate reductase B